MPSLKIRDAQPDDAAVIVRLIQELAADDGVASPIDETYARDYLFQPKYNVLLAEMDGSIVGLLSYMWKSDLYHAGDTCYIAELIVSEGYRSQGIGSALMQLLMGRVIEQGCVEISVSTMSDNLGARIFYSRHGFEDEAVLLERHF